MFFKNKETDVNQNFIKVAALLIHAAKIDQDYSENEEKIIIKALLEIGINKESIQQIMRRVFQYINRRSYTPTLITKR